MYSVVCTFKRKEGGKREYGILVQAKINVIIDLEGLPVDGVWDFTELPYEGYFMVTDTRE